MKQRARIRRIKDRTYPWLVYAYHRRQAWERVKQSYRKLSDAMREAYERSRA